MADKKTTTMLVLAGAIIVGIIILGGSAIRIVNAGSVQVVTSFGKVTNKILDPGANFIVPFIESTLTYNTRKVIYEATSPEKQAASNADYKDIPVDTATKDGQQVNIYYTVRFSVNPEKVIWIPNHIGNEMELVEKIVKTDSRIWVRIIPREFEADQLYTGNVQEVQIKIEEKLKPLFEDNGILLDEVGIREIKFTDEYIKAIEAKQIEAVKIQTERNKAEQAKFQKEQLITQSEGQAKQQELLRSSITSELLQKLWIEKWNGQLPTVMGQGTNLLDISSMIKK
jgi:regulator of protease activity HflC (stomatin/prohibitin superfamily)